MRELGALGRPGRAGRVEDHGGVRVVGVHHFGPGFGCAHGVLELPGRDDQTLGAGVIGAGLGVLGKAVPGEQQLRAGILEIERDLAALEKDVHRDDDRAGAQHSVITHGEIRDVRQHDPHAIAAGDAVLGEQTGDVRAGAVECGVGELGVVELDRDVVAVAIGRFGEEVREVHLLSLRARSLPAPAPAHRAFARSARRRRLRGGLL